MQGPCGCAWDFWRVEGVFTNVVAGVSSHSSWLWIQCVLSMLPIRSIALVPLNDFSSPFWSGIILLIRLNSADKMELNWVYWNLLSQSNKWKYYSFFFFNCLGEIISKVKSWGSSYPNFYSAERRITMTGFLIWPHDVSELKPSSGILLCVGHCYDRRVPEIWECSMIVGGSYLEQSRVPKIKPRWISTMEE